MIWGNAQISLVCVIWESFQEENQVLRCKLELARGKEVGQTTSMLKNQHSQRHETVWCDLETLSSLVLNGSQSDQDRMVVMVNRGRLYLAHRKFSAIIANFLPPVNDGNFKNKEMRDKLRVDWVVVGWWSYQDQE